MAHFEIQDLTFSYPNSRQKALDHISLRVQEGEYIAFCGKSGSGKTTLLRHLKTVLTPHGQHSGTVLFCGRPLQDADLREQSSQIGYVMQDPDSQIVTDKVWHELAFGLESLGCDPRTMRLRVAEMANYFGIQHWFHKKVSELSGGQKQLLNLASVMAMQPSVLILDEPTSQLDPIAAADFLNTVRKINRELGTTVLISEHRLEDVFPSADRVVVMENGRIAAQGMPREIGFQLEREHNDMVAALPSPMQIFYGLKSTLECPLTVREGRSWLSRAAGDQELAVTALPEPAFEDPEDAQDVVLEIKEAWFRYERQSPDVLKGVNLAVPKGSIFAVVGGNGAGKSTMLKTICNICKPYRGKVLVNGKRVNQYKAGELFRQNLAMLPQDPRSLFVKSTVQDELLEMLKVLPGTLEEKETLINQVARDCEIVDLLEMHPYDLSGGEQQRAALAKVLLCEPKLLLLDEPTKGLDNFYKQKLARVLERFRHNGGTILMVSHDVEFCAQYANWVAMFFDGQILTVNTPSGFFSQNSFYTTAANRMSRHLFQNAVTNQDVIRLCQLNGIGQ